jgi:hypothetical protein
VALLAKKIRVYLLILGRLFGDTRITLFPLPTFTFLEVVNIVAECKMK